MSIEIEGIEKACGRSTFFRQQGEEEVLGTEVGVMAFCGLKFRSGEHRVDRCAHEQVKFLLRWFGEAGMMGDMLFNGFDRHAVMLQYVHGDTLLESKKSDDEMDAGKIIARTQTAAAFSGESDNPFTSGCELHVFDFAQV